MRILLMCAFLGGLSFLRGEDENIRAEESWIQSMKELVEKEEILYDKLDGNWVSECGSIKLQFDYRTLIFHTKGSWRDLDEVKTLLSSEQAFFYRNDSFFVTLKENDELVIFRQAPHGSENYEKVIFHRKK